MTFTAEHPGKVLSQGQEACAGVSSGFSNLSRFPMFPTLSRPLGILPCRRNLCIAVYRIKKLCRLRYIKAETICLETIHRVKKAIKELETYKKRRKEMAEINSFRVWDEDLDKEYFTAEEVAKSDLAADFVSESIQARRANGTSHRNAEKKPE